MRISKYQIDALTVEVKNTYDIKHKKAEDVFNKKYKPIAQKEADRIVKALERIPLRYREIIGEKYSGCISKDGEVNKGLIRDRVVTDYYNRYAEIPQYPSDDEVRHEIVLASIGAENVDQLVATVCANLDKKLS